MSRSDGVVESHWAKSYNMAANQRNRDTSQQPSVPHGSGHGPLIPASFTPKYGPAGFTAEEKAYLLIFGYNKLCQTL